MEADFSVELGPDAAALELPWEADNGAQYYDLKRHPELLASVPEADQYSELRDFLAFLNAPGMPVETAKCDVWTSEQIAPDEEIFGAKLKYASYVDLLFADGRRFSLCENEELARRTVSLLRRVPEIPASAEMIIRRCYYNEGGDPDTSRDGFYFSWYVSGFGDDRDQARQRWAIAKKLAENALRQVFATARS